MNSVNQIKAKIKQIEKLLTEIKDELEILGRESQTHPKKQTVEFQFYSPPRFQIYSPLFLG